MSATGFCSCYPKTSQNSERSISQKIGLANWKDWKNNFDALDVVGLHENWTLARRFQVSAGVGLSYEKGRIGPGGSTNRGIGGQERGQGSVQRLAAGAASLIEGETSVC